MVKLCECGHKKGKHLLDFDNHIQANLISPCMVGYVRLGKDLIQGDFQVDTEDKCNCIEFKLRPPTFEEIGLKIRKRKGR